MITRQHLLSAVAGILQKVPDIVAVAALSGGASELIKELRRQRVAGRIIGSRLLTDPQEVELFGEERKGTMVVAGFWRGRTERSGNFNTSSSRRSRCGAFTRWARSTPTPRPMTGVCLVSS